MSCDEPTSALDPIGRREILDILLKVKERTTVLFSTHAYGCGEGICDRVGILDRGKIVLTGSVSRTEKHALETFMHGHFPDAGVPLRSGKIRG